MTNERFFTESQEQSAVKATITSKFFWSWAKLVEPRARKHGSKMAYIDLFAGPGRYEDGAISTPLMILETAIAEPKLHDRLVTLFNDKDPELTSKLAAEIRSFPGIEKLKYAPQICCEEIGEEIVACFKELRMIPTLMFVDPWGYKGLSLHLVQAVLKNWGCDCIFFFNYNRVNMGLSNPRVQEHMEALFGEERAQALTETLSTLPPQDRELTIVDELVAAHKEYGATYVLPFRFRNEQGTRTSHHLIFATKNFTAYHIMKEIMAKMSSSQVQGVPSFEYSPADERYPRLFSLNASLDDLGPSLETLFAGRNMSVEEIYKAHSVDTPYVKPNYKEVLMRLEEEGRLTALPDRESLKPGTMADRVLITFLERR